MSSAVAVVEIGVARVGMPMDSHHGEFLDTVLGSHLLQSAQRIVLTRIERGPRRGRERIVFSLPWCRLGDVCSKNVVLSFCRTRFFVVMDGVPGMVAFIHVSVFSAVLIGPLKMSIQFRAIFAAF